MLSSQNQLIGCSLGLPYSYWLCFFFYCTTVGQVSDAITTMSKTLCFPLAGPTVAQQGIFVSADSLRGNLICCVLFRCDNALPKLGNLFGYLNMF